MWSTCAVVDLLRDQKHSENALSAPVSPTINWTFVREDNSGRLQSLNSFHDGLTLSPHKALLSPDMPCKLVAPRKLLRTTAPRAREGAFACQRRNHQWIEIPGKFSLTIDTVSNFLGQYCLKKGASQPGLLFQLLLWLTKFKKTKIT